MFNKKILLFLLFGIMLFGVVTKNAKAANDCACAERVALTLYDIKSIITSGSNDACMNTCRSNGNEFYAYPDVSSLTAGSYRIMYVDGFRYASNCACLAGSLIPLYYPVGSLSQVSGGKTECNNVCYSKSAQYYAYEAMGALSGWKTAVTAPAADAPAPTNTSTAGSMITDTKIPGTTEAGGLIQCGRPGQDMCTLCNLIEHMNAIIQYLMKLAIGVALLMMAIGGVIYIVSAGDSGLMDKAKGAIMNAAIGFVIIFSAYLIINTTITYLGTYSNLGIQGVGSWGQFECKRQEPVQ